MTKNLDRATYQFRIAIEADAHKVGKQDKSKADSDDYGGRYVTPIRYYQSSGGLEYLKSESPSAT